MQAANIEVSRTVLCHRNPYTGEALDAPYEEATYRLPNPCYNAAAMAKVHALQEIFDDCMSYRTLRGAVDANPESTVNELAALLRA